MKNTKTAMAMAIILMLFIGISSVHAQEVRTVKAGYYASVSEAILDKAIDYATAKDYEALKKLIKANLIFTMREGLRVYVVDEKLLSGKVKIRPVGHTIELWTVRGALD